MVPSGESATFALPSNHPRPLLVSGGAWRAGRSILRWVYLIAVPIGDFGHFGMPFPGPRTLGNIWGCAPVHSGARSQAQRVPRLLVEGSSRSVDTGDEVPLDVAAERV